MPPVMSDYTRFLVGGIPLLFESQSWGPHVSRIAEQYVFKDQVCAEGFDSVIIERDHADTHSIMNNLDSRSDYVRHSRDDSQDRYEIYSNRSRVFKFNYNHGQRRGIAYVSSVIPELNERIIVNGKVWLDSFFNRVFDVFVYAVVLAAHGGLIFHGASLVSPAGNGVLLCGPSGAGKSTLAERLQMSGYEVINDETAIVMPQEKHKYRLFPLPWSQPDFHQRYAHGVPLSAIAMLEHGAQPTSEYQRFSFQTAIMQLAENIRYFQTLTRVYPELMHTVISLAKHVPTGKMRHALGDKSIVDLFEHIKEGYNGQ
jgi:AAA domain